MNLKNIFKLFKKKSVECQKVNPVDDYALALLEYEKTQVQLQEIANKLFIDAAIAKLNYLEKEIKALRREMESNE